MINMLAALALFAAANSCTPQMKTYKVKMKGGEEQTVRATNYYIHREGVFGGGKVLYVTFDLGSNIDGQAGMLQGEIEYIIEASK